MSGYPDDSRPGRDAQSGRYDGLPSARLCPGCGRSTADDVCLHCAAEDHFRTSSLVRGFLAAPDRQAAEWSSVPPSGGGPGDGMRGRADAAGSPPPTGTAVPTFVSPPVPPPRSARSAMAPQRAARGRRWEESTARGPADVAASVAIALAAILLATVVGIVGAIVTGPADLGGPGEVGGPDRVGGPGGSDAPR